MSRFTKKPITVEAIAFEELIEFAGVNETVQHDGIILTKKTDEQWLVRTATGIADFTPKDMLITGVDGEVYPCPKDVFEKTYAKGEHLPLSAKTNRGLILTFAKMLGVDPDDISDGYHTFQDLYDHRKALFVALTKSAGGWRSKQHSDGTMHEGYFIVGINYAKGAQITYHYELKDWDKFEHCTTQSHAPEFDGHTPEDVVERLLKL